MGSLQAATSPWLLAAEAFLLTKPQRLRWWRGWHAAWHLGPSLWKHGVGPLTGLSVGLPKIPSSWGKRETGTPTCRQRRVDPKVSRAASAHSKCRPAWGRGPLDSRGLRGTRRPAWGCSEAPGRACICASTPPTSRHPRPQEVNLRRACPRRWEMTKDMN